VARAGRRPTAAAPADPEGGSPYFAYGSNMGAGVMARLCPNSTFVATARLPDYRLAFTRRSVRTGTGVADVVPEPGAETWGVLYELDPADRAALDRKEGLGWAYERLNVVVETAAGSAPAATYSVIAKEPAEVPPSPAYAAALCAAARERGLPARYLAALEAGLAPAAGG
jgi:hypothetical protein